MSFAEARNEEGNKAFQLEDYDKAAASYFEAVKADGNVAKYRTNLANTLLKLGRYSEALEQAAAAVAVDPTWPKGFLFKALAHEQLGDLTHAMAACEDGLKIHRHNPSLEEAQKRLHRQQVNKHGQQEHKKQQAVTYEATVRDATGQEQTFHFTSWVDRQRVLKADTDKAEAVSIMQEVTMPHYKEMLSAKPWKCVTCNEPATTLFLHPLSYLHHAEPAVKDFGPTPACSSQQCAIEIKRNVNQVMAEIGAPDGTS